VVQKLGELNTVFVDTFAWWTLNPIFSVQVDVRKHDLSAKPHKPAGLHVGYELPSSVFMATTSIPQILKLCDN
jgi:hypothetical protein